MTITIYATGGTLSKRYNPLTGALDIQKDSQYLSSLLYYPSCNHTFIIHELIHKDSLDFTDDDRVTLEQVVSEVKGDVIILHGTDTMGLSAHVIAKTIPDKRVIFVGAMTPLSIDPVEGAMNFALALGFLNANPTNGVYIAMHGLVAPALNIKKDTIRGVFSYA